MEKKRVSSHISIINKAFDGMKERNEKFVIVCLWDKLSTITLPSGGILQTDFVRVDLMRQKEKNSIRVFYRHGAYELFPFTHYREKQLAIHFLRKNNILPTEEEFLAARSLSNTSGIENVLGCMPCNN